MSTAVLLCTAEPGAHSNVQGAPTGGQRSYLPAIAGECCCADVHCRSGGTLTHMRCSHLGSAPPIRKQLLVSTAVLVHCGAGRTLNHMRCSHRGSASPICQQLLGSAAVLMCTAELLGAHSITRRASIGGLRPAHSSAIAGEYCCADVHNRTGGTLNH